MATIRLMRRLTGAVCQVSVEVHKEPGFRMSLTVGATMEGLIASQGDPASLRAAARAACLSGAAYAKRMLCVEDVHLEIWDISGRCGPGDMDGFAIAALWAVAAAIGRESSLKKQDTEEWEAVLRRDP